VLCRLVTPAAAGGCTGLGSHLQQAPCSNKLGVELLVEMMHTRCVRCIMLLQGDLKRHHLTQQNDLYWCTCNCVIRATSSSWVKHLINHNARAAKD
jgi:hypothetical protein